jgi:DNA-binding transcriptional MerR regulator
MTMEHDVISKKELLELTGISYGQLYRWKRKNLIPEDWFIRKSTFTGQETFFPRAKILARIHKIQNMKDGLSLDEIADMFSPAATDIRLQLPQLLKQNIVTRASIDVYQRFSGKTDVFSFEKLLHVYVLDKVLQSGAISLDEGAVFLHGVTQHHRKFQGKPFEVILLRKLGVTTCALVSSPSEVYFDEATKVVARLSIASCIEELKLKLTHWEDHLDE